jgi:hypothetical protein
MILLTHWREAMIAALLAALAVTVAVYTASGSRKDARIEALTAERDLAITAHAVTRQSVATLQAAIASQNAEIEARARAYADTRAADAADVAAADRAATAEGIRRARLQGIAEAAARHPACPVPAQLVQSLEGL